MSQDLNFMELSKSYICPKCGAPFPESLKMKYRSDGNNEWLDTMCVQCEFEWLEHIVSTTEDAKRNVEQKFSSKNIEGTDSMPHNPSESN